MTKPVMVPGMTLVEYFSALDTWKEEGPWVPAAGGTETPFMTGGGKRLLYCYHPRSGKHAYLDCDSDIILTFEEAMLYLGTK